ncbi:thiopurine S-methyltransferase [uncultured Pseudoteredinibacter sp.]|uniref:thiopurine S-methyltransferase n=1 Tax=uncultured Pseudoteredinibacter sp. TaxID=1641701 RepID=UPI00261C72F6|nr:thiopurine S-methyltransferase [uncultured Pseudoteredinibacter sp.]
MEKEFWLQRWQEQQIGFHEGRFNNSLLEHWPTLNARAGDTVFVPLCGKSLDMVFLAEQGLQVIGVELSQIAVEEFFQEQGLEPHVEQAGALQKYQAANYTLYCGDLFALNTEQLSTCRWIYDRASMIALPLDMRRQYCEFLANSLPRPSQSLLITLEYDQSLKSGPPFSISPAMLDELISGSAEIEPLGQIPEEVKGIVALEHSFLLRFK